MSYLKNGGSLVSSGEIKLKQLALDIVEDALLYADPGVAAKKLISLDGDHLKIGNHAFNLSGDRRIFVIGTGKATFPVAKVLDVVLGSRIHKGFIACKKGQKGSLKNIELHLSSHPIPCQDSVVAADKTIELLDEVKPDDIIIACVSGGSSSLFVRPVDGISLEDKAATGHTLLTCGANIIEINAVRKHISKVKGGRLIKGLPAGVTLVNLTVSDVIGDPLDYITDLTVPDTSTFADAKATLDKYELWDVLPASVTNYLKLAPESEETATETSLAHINRIDIVLQKADAACTGACEAVRKAGLTPVLLSTFFEGESSCLGRSFAAIARQILFDNNPKASPCVLIGGGETIVSTFGAKGMGGPNQEFVTSAAVELRGLKGVVVAALDTDGTDGPTPYAGAIADGYTAELAKEKGINLNDALRRHNVSPALDAIGALILTGDTGTNVNDLKIMIIAPQISN